MGLKSVLKMFELLLTMFIGTVGRILIILRYFPQDNIVMCILLNLNKLKM